MGVYVSTRGIIVTVVGNDYGESSSKLFAFDKFLLDIFL